MNFEIERLLRQESRRNKSLGSPSKRRNRCNTMKKTTKLALGAALGVLMLAGIPSAAFAQNDVSGKNISSLDYESADVREALRALFKNVGVSYTIASDVQGLVTVHLRNVPFETALQQITRQVDATYRIEGGVYQIVKREDQNPNVVVGGNDQVIPASNKVRRQIRIRFADPQFIALLLGPDKGSQDFSLAPEVSTVRNTPQSQGLGGGGGGGFGGGGGGGFGGGGGGFGGGGGGFGGGGGGFGGGGGGFGGGGGGGSFGGGGGGFGR